MNKYQKLILLLYGLIFIYFSLINVPFRIEENSEIEYDILFSNKANLDLGRFSLIILIITLITVVLLLLTQNLNLIFKLRFTPNLKTVFYFLLGIVIIGLSIIYFIKYDTNSTKTKSNLDAPQSVRSDSLAQNDIHTSLKYKYIYKGKLYDFSDILEAAKQSKLYVGSYIQKTGILVIDEESYPIPRSAINETTKKIWMIFPDGSMKEINVEDTLDAINILKAARY